MTLFCLIVAIGCILTLPRLALIDLHRSGATETFVFDIRWMTAAVAIGAAATVAAGIGSDLPAHSRMILVVVGSILALGAWIDRISAWAPDALMLPFCLAIFLAAPDIAGPADIGVAIGFGALLFVAGIALWILQDALDARVAPPADLVAIAAPFILFGVSMYTAAVFAATSLCLIAALKSRRVAAVFSRPEAVADGARDTAIGDAKAVTFLSVLFPVLLCAQVAALA